MIHHETADASGARAVEVDSRHSRRIVWQEEIAIDSREHRNQSQRRDTKSDTQRIERANRCRLREEHDAHDEEGDGEEGRRE